MKLGKVKLLTILWSISVLSTFIAPIKVYPICFIGFIVFFVVLNLSEIKLNGRIITLISLILCFMIILVFSALIGAIEESFFSLRDNVKFLINYLWLGSSILFYSYCCKKSISYGYIIDNFFILIFVLCFLQLLIKVSLLGLWLAPFDGTNSSSVASYILDTIPTFFGDNNKNIFSTKVVFITIMMIFMRDVGYVDRKGNVLLILMGFLFVLYSMSRTGQVVYLLFLATLFFRRIYVYEKFKFLKPVLYIFILFLGFLFIQIALSSFFHFDLSSDQDGFAARLVLWATYINHINEIGFIGDGAFSASNFIGIQLGRIESNFHNVLMNLSFETGWLGLFFYFLILSFIFYSQRTKKYPLYWSVLLIPFFACINSQYVGYSPDEIIYLANSFNLLVYIKNK